MTIKAPYQPPAPGVVEAAVDLLYAIGYGHLAVGVGGVEAQDTMIEAAQWLEYLDDHGHLDAGC